MNDDNDRTAAGKLQLALGAQSEFERTGRCNQLNPSKVGANCAKHLAGLDLMQPINLASGLEPEQRRTGQFLPAADDPEWRVPPRGGHLHTIARHQHAL